MKHLLTLTALLISSLAMGQFPNLPYNPDDNADGLIGVADLQALLANYGSEFASAVVSEDGESAIVYMGEMHYAPCALACKNLPGLWQTSEIEDLALIWNDVCNATTNTETWLQPSKCPPTDNETYRVFISRDESTQNSGQHYVATTSSPVVNRSCYCAAKQLPRVEYTMCSTTSSDTFLSCCEERVTEGWMPLSGSNPASAGADNFRTYSQAFWRWAE